MQTHAANPKALWLWDDVFRIFFGTRDANNHSQIAFVDIDLNQPKKILAISSEPVLSAGRAGAFDDCGVLPSCLIELDGELALYYTGISLSGHSRYSSFCGLSFLNKSRDKAYRFSECPILERVNEDPISGGMVFIWKDKSSKKFRMWYETCEGWYESAGKQHACMNLKYASSNNGVTWTRSHRSFRGSTGHNDTYYSSPTIVEVGDHLNMWYSFKENGNYRIGFATSADGLEWSKQNGKACLSVSRSAWENREVTYPFVFRHLQNHYILYNGNDYGKTGFGLAKLVSRAG